MILVAAMLAVAYVWSQVVVPILAMPFGIGLRVRLTGFSKWREEIDRLDFPAYVVVHGILTLGFGFVLMSLVGQYVEWRYFGGQPLNLIRDVVFGSILWSILGTWIAVASR